MAEAAHRPFYIAILLYQATGEAGGKGPMYQESFVLLQAANEEEAREQAMKHARQQNATYQNAKGETIQWSLKQIVDVSPVLDAELKHGSELYARHFRNYDAYHAFEPLLGGSTD